MSILQTGQAIGGVVFLPLVALAVLKLGWRSAAMLSGGHPPDAPWFFWSGARLRAWVSCLTARPSPHPLRSASRQDTDVRPGLVELTTKEALNSSAFWLIAGFHSLRNIPYAGNGALVPLLVWKGFDESTAAFFVGLMSFSAVIVRPLTGWLGDRWSKQKIGATGVILGAWVSACSCSVVADSGTWSSSSPCSRSLMVSTR